MKQLIQLFLFLYISTLFSQNSEYTIINTSINSIYAELGVTYLTGNTILFASSKKNDDDKSFKKNRRKNNSNLGLELYQGVISENGDLIETGKFTNKIKNMFFESDISLTPDLKTIYFTWNNFYNTQKRIDSAKWRTLHIMKADLNENLELSNIKRLPFNSEKYSVRSPEVSKDGKQLYFVSDMPNGFGKTDIYVINILGENSYSKPKNLGPTINTKEDELYPFVDKNNTLYFSSYGHKGKGNLDIFKSDFKKESYQKVVNLPSPINSEFDDFYFVINSSSNSGYFTSNREQGKGDVDIYAFKAKGIENEKICYQTISGLLFNIENNQSIANAQVSLFQNNVLVETQTISKDSKFNFEVACNESYKIIAQKEGFLKDETELKTDDKINTVISKTLYLTPIKCNQLISGTVLNSDNQQFLENVKISLFENEVLKETIIVSENATFNFEVKCNDVFKIVAQKEGFLKGEIELKTNDVNTTEISKTLYLTPIKCNQLISVTVLNSDNQQFLENVKISLFQNEVLKETITVSENAKFNFEVKCNEVFKIVAQKEGFLKGEIELKTNDVNTTEISKTLYLTPIKCNQFITGTVLNSENQQFLGNVKISLFQNYILKESQTISENTKFNFEVKCNEVFKIVAQKEGFLKGEIELKTNDVNTTEISKTLYLTPIKCNQLISGTVLNSDNQQFLENVKISLFQNEVLKETIIVSENAKFNFEVKCNEVFKIVAQKEGFLKGEIELKTGDVNTTEISKTLYLTPIKCNQFITGTVLNSENQQFLGNVKISLFQNYILKESQTISENTKFNFEVKCNETFKIVAQKEGFLKGEIELKTNDVNTTEISKTLYLTPIKCNQLITGTVLNSENKQFLGNVKVSLFQNDILKETIVVSENTKFNFEVKCNITFKIVAQKEGFLKGEIELKTNDVNTTEISKSLYLTPIKCNQLITGVILDKETNKALSKAQVRIFKNLDLIEALTIHNNASFKYELACNSNYRIITSLRNYEDNLTLISTSKKRNENLNRTILLKPTIEFITINEVKMIKTDAIHFDLDQSEIRPGAAAELAKVISILYKYPTIKIEINSHTDSRAPDNYNMNLSNKRAQSTINYIISKGIDPSRVSGKGYGETKLVNKCSNGVKCTQAEHEMNRRTEFVIIDE